MAVIGTWERHRGFQPAGAASAPAPVCLTGQTYFWEPFDAVNNAVWDYAGPGSVTGGQLAATEDGINTNYIGASMSVGKSLMPAALAISGASPLRIIGYYAPFAYAGSGALGQGELTTAIQAVCNGSATIWDVLIDWIPSGNQYLLTFTGPGGFTLGPTVVGPDKFVNSFEMKVELRFDNVGAKVYFADTQIFSRASAGLVTCSSLGVQAGARGFGGANKWKCPVNAVQLIGAGLPQNCTG